MTYVSPLPWSWSEEFSWVRDAKGFYTCSPWDNADGKFIVTACNSHHALLAACEEALETMRMQEKREREEFHIPQPTAKAIWDETIGQIEEAIRAAKGEEPKS